MLHSHWGAFRGLSEVARHIWGERMGPGRLLGAQESHSNSCLRALPVGGGGGGGHIEDPF